MCSFFYCSGSTHFDPGGVSSSLESRSWMYGWMDGEMFSREFLFQQYPQILKMRKIGCSWNSHKWMSQGPSSHTTSSGCSVMLHVAALPRHIVHTTMAAASKPAFCSGKLPRLLHWTPAVASRVQLVKQFNNSRWTYITRCLLKLPVGPVNHSPVVSEKYRTLWVPVFLQKQLISRLDHTWKLKTAQCKCKLLSLCVLCCGSQTKRSHTPASTTAKPEAGNPADLPMTIPATTQLLLSLRPPKSRPRARLETAVTTIMY